MNVRRQLICFRYLQKVFREKRKKKKQTKLKKKKTEKGTTKAKLLIQSPLAIYLNSNKCLFQFLPIFFSAQMFHWLYSLPRLNFN